MYKVSLRQRDFCRDSVGAHFDYELSGCDVFVVFLVAADLGGIKTPLRRSGGVRLENCADGSGAGLPKSRKQEEWYYRRSGLMNRSPFMLRSDSYEPVLPEYLAANLVAEAARDLGIKDDTVRLALSNSILREGSKAIRDVDVAAEIGAHACGLEKGKLAGTGASRRKSKSGSVRAQRIGRRSR